MTFPRTPPEDQDQKDPEIQGAQGVQEDSEDEEDEEEINPNDLPRPPIPWERIKDKIDNYEIKLPNEKIESTADSSARAESILGKDAYAVLHKKTAKNKDTSHRKKFVDLLQKIMEKQDTKKLSDPITLEELLGKEGFKLYLKAVKEESESKAYRDAVFLEATKHYEGPRWNTRLVLWVGGPSASGKSYAVKSMIKHASKNIMTSDDTDQSGNYVVSIDGGIEREVSQMRQLVLQVALEKHYRGIKDLHKHTKLGIKGKIKKAALENYQLNLVIPNTFVKMRNRSVRNAWLLKQKFKQYTNMHNVTQVFGEISGGKYQESFKNTTSLQGEMRAFKNPNDISKNTGTFDINNRNIGYESKVYQGKYFDHGVKATEAAKEAYLEAQKSEENKDNKDKKGKSSHYITYTNDRVFVYCTGTRWFTCPANFKGEEEIVALSREAFNKWEKLEKNEKNLHIPKDPKLNLLPSQEQYAALKAWLKAEESKESEELKESKKLKIESIIRQEPDKAINKALLLKVISIIDVNKYIKDHKLDFNNQKTIETGMDLVKIINKIALQEDPTHEGKNAHIRQYFANAYIKIGEKEGGANKPGKYGGIYKKVSDNSTYLFKQDTSYKIAKTIPRNDPHHHVAKDISEFVATKLASGMYDNVAPDMEVKLHPAQASPYIGSKFFGGGKNETYVDLFKDIYRKYYRVNELKQLLEGKPVKEINQEDIDGGYVDPEYVELRRDIKNMRAIDANKIIQAHLDSVEKHVKALKDRPKMLGTKQFLDTIEGRIFKDAISRKVDGKLVYENIEKTLVMSALFADNDVHSGNIGVVITKNEDGSESRRCVRIDFGAALAKEYFNTERALKLGSEQRMKFLTANPTNHFNEYPKSVVYTKEFADAIEEGIGTLRNDMEKQLELFNSDEFNLWPHADRVAFANYIGVKDPEVSLSKMSDEELNAHIKTYVKDVLEYRMNLLSQYELDIRLSLCFTVKDGVFALDENKKNEFQALIKQNMKKDEFKDYFRDEVFNTRKFKLRSSLPESRNLFAKMLFAEEVNKIYSANLVEVAGEGVRKLDDDANFSLKDFDFSASVSGRKPVGFTDENPEKVIFSQKIPISSSNGTRANFTEKCAADGSLSIICSNPPLELVDKKTGLPTWECLQYVKDQIRELLKAFPPPGELIIDVFDAKYLHAYAMICNDPENKKYNIRLGNKTGKDYPSLVVPDDYELAYKLKISEPITEAIPRSFWKMFNKKKGPDMIDIALAKGREFLTGITNENKDGSVKDPTQTMTSINLLKEQLKSIKKSTNPSPSSAQQEQIERMLTLIEDICKRKGVASVLSHDVPTQRRSIS